MSSGKRYKFNGSLIRLSTGFGAPITITGISNDEPALVTAANTFALGDVVKIQGAMAALNDDLFAVDNPDAGDFELAGTDTTDYPAFVAPADPTTAQVLPAVFSEFCELTGVNQQDGTADQIDVTTVCSTAKEFEIGLADSGTLSLDFHFAPNSPMQAAIRSSRRTADPIAVQIRFPRNGGTVVAFGYVTDSGFTGSNGGVWDGTATLKLTGEMAVFAAAE